MRLRPRSNAIILVFAVPVMLFLGGGALRSRSQRSSGNQAPVHSPAAAPRAIASLSPSKLPARLTLVYTTSLLGNLTHCACGGVNQGGIARIATVIERLTNGYENTDRGRSSKDEGLLVVDAGGFAEPGFPYRQVQINAIGRFFNLADYDVVNAEYRESETGNPVASVTKERKAFDQLSWVCANIVDATNQIPIITPYALRWIAGARVAIVGLASPESVQIAKIHQGAYSGTAQFYAQKALEFKATLKGELRQSSPSLLIVFPDDNPISQAAIFAMLQQYPVPSDRIKAGQSSIAAKLQFASKGKYGAKEAHALLKIDRTANLAPRDAEAKRIVITSLVSDIERFERMAKEWIEKDQRQQEVESKKQRKLTVRDPIETMQELMPKLRQHADIAVVLSQCGLANDRNIARTFPSVIVIGGVGATVLKAPEQAERSWILPTSAQGADVCKVNVEVNANRNGDGDKDNRTLDVQVKDFQRHPVIAGVPEDPQVQKVLENYFAELAHQAQRTVRQMPAGRRFVGSHKCIECHKEDGKIWKESKHAHALETLKSEMGILAGHGQKFPANRINECYLCHRVSPPEGMTESKAGGAATPIDSVGCESCHGAGELHASDGKRPIPVSKPAEATCFSCHTPSRSPKFGFVRFWEQIQH